MNMLSPFLTLKCSCDEALLWTKKQLSQAGLRVIQTFDLHAARHTLDDCPCPHHGTRECDCQMLVLLVYGEVVEPATLVLHGNDGQTWLSIADNPRQRADAKLINSIRQALEIKTPVSISRAG